MPIGASSTTLPVRPRELALVVALQRRTGPLLARWMVGADRWGRGWLWAAVALTLGAAGGRPGRQAAAEMLLLTTISLPSYHLVKRLARRPRPAAASPLVASLALPLDRWSFPSGHTLHAVAYTQLAAAAEPLLVVVLVPATLLVALSRVGLGLHYPSDVAAGALLGSALAGLITAW